MIITCEQLSIDVRDVTCYLIDSHPMWQRTRLMTETKSAVGKMKVGSIAVRALALGALAIGATAIGALAVAIGSLRILEARIEKLSIGTL